MSELRVKNHYIPEVYLKQWEDSESKVCVYKTLASHQNQRVWKSYSAGAIAYQRHLYTQYLSGSESDEFERWLDKNYESPASDVIEKAITDQKLSKDDWDILIRFLTSQDVRTPARLLDHLDRERDLYQDTLQKSLEDVKKMMEINDVDELKKLDGLKRDNRTFPLKVITELDPNREYGTLRVESYIGRATWLHSIRSLLESTEQVLHTHKWSIIKPAKGYSWFTSDNPVIKLNFTNDNKYDFGGGWGRKKGNIIFPISPQHAMFVQIGDRPMLKGTRLSISETRQIRKFIAEHAHRKIFSNYFDADVFKLRPRIVSPSSVKQEREQLEGWHNKNIALESEYFK